MFENDGSTFVVEGHEVIAFPEAPRLEVIEAQPVTELIATYDHWKADPFDTERGIALENAIDALRE
jgi:hypothetical protein